MGAESPKACFGAELTCEGHLAVCCCSCCNLLPPPLRYSKLNADNVFLVLLCSALAHWAADSVASSQRSHRAACGLGALTLLRLALMPPIATLVDLLIFNLLNRSAAKASFNC